MALWALKQKMGSIVDGLDPMAKSLQKLVKAFTFFFIDFGLHGLKIGQ